MGVGDEMELRKSCIPNGNGLSHIGLHHSIPPQVSRTAISHKSHFTPPMLPFKGGIRLSQGFQCTMYRLFTLLRLVL